MIMPGNIALFEGLSPEERASLLDCFGTKERRFLRGECLIREGDRVSDIGIVLAGAVRVERTDFRGNRTIIASFGSGSVFGESFACAGIPRSPVSVVAESDGAALFLPFERLLRTCENACGFHRRIVENMIRMIARKNLVLNGRLEIVSLRTIREKALAYFASLPRRAAEGSTGLHPGGQASGGYTVELPFSRTELADYLCVDRSALSRELGLMRDGGIIALEDRRVTVFH